jgi:hypothetical protein
MMNRKQKILTVVGLLVFCVNVFNAPWERNQHLEGMPSTSDVRYGPVWGLIVLPEDYHLQIAPLFLTWAAIGVVRRANR